MLGEARIESTQKLSEYSPSGKREWKRKRKRKAANDRSAAPRALDERRPVGKGSFMKGGAQSGKQKKSSFYSFCAVSWQRSKRSPEGASGLTQHSGMPHVQSPPGNYSQPQEGKEASDQQPDTKAHDDNILAAGL